MSKLEQIKEYKQQLLADFNSRTNYDNGRFYIPIAQRLIEVANLQSARKILDVATGTGIVALAAAEKVGAQSKVIGIDISAGMLSNAREKLAVSGLQNVEFIEADAELIDFEQNSFDVILCSLAICYLTDIQKALYKWHSFLKPGGKLVFNAWTENAFTTSVLFREVAARYGIIVTNPNAPLGTSQKCQQLLSAAGFENKNIIIQQDQFGWYFTPNVDSAEQIWEVNAKNVFGYQVQQLAPEKLQECFAEYIKEVQALPVTEKGAWCDASIFFVTAAKI
ncbi:MAG: methyltransferase domain-containing protein [Calothrix sp. FI2-JRJ7]|jgi:ubiquinone/menaquinone biosynthesis C-methylase UbiE|nr:methyltransferase domain-containing protein [Calothrix sp. FI2-JRJ7]